MGELHETLLAIVGALNVADQPTTTFATPGPAIIDCHLRRPDAG